MRVRWMQGVIKKLAMPYRKSDNAAMKNRSLREAVAQMVIPRIDGPKLGDPVYQERCGELVRQGIGGFIIFGGDIGQTPGYLRDLQGMSVVPLLIASDVERGLGQQLVGGTNFPSQRAVASAIKRQSKKDVDLLERMLDAVRQETRAAGIHAVFSPVVDVNNNPDNPIICTRAFGDEPEIVEWFGSRYIRGLQKTTKQGTFGLLACAKHFPGHGDTDRDSHSVLPVIRADKQRLNRIELPPFREAVKSGVGMVMVAHLLVPELDPAAPTTFSKKVVTALLREGMGFEGLIVTDALDMGALAEQYSQEEIAVRSVEAGMDILLHPGDAQKTIDAVVAAVEQGRLTQQRIDESVDRIMHAKKKLGLFDKDGPDSGPIEYELHQGIAREVGRKALRIVDGGRKNVLPLRTDTGVACFVLDDDGSHDSSTAFIRVMQERFKHMSLLVLTRDEGVPVSLVNDCIHASGFVVVALFSRISASKGRSGISEKLRATADDILRTARSLQVNTVVISFDSPYILDLFKNADVRIAAYDRMEEIQRAAARLLAGE
jgi:beta-glucosidase-like glycosyl hydrolase